MRIQNLIIVTLLIFPSFIQAQSLTRKAVLDSLPAAANELNKQLPKMIDDVTRMESAWVSGETFTMAYTLTEQTAESIPMDMKNFLSKQAIDGYCNASGDAGLYRQHDIKLNLRYRGKSGKLIMSVLLDSTECIQKKILKTFKTEQEVTAYLQKVSAQSTDAERRRMWEDAFGEIGEGDIDKFMADMAVQMAQLAPMKINKYQWLTSSIYLPEAKLYRMGYIISEIQDTLSAKEFGDAVHTINQNNYCTNSKLWWARIGDVDIIHSYKDSEGNSILVDRIMHGSCKQ